MNKKREELLMYMRIALLMIRIVDLMSCTPVVATSLEGDMNIFVDVRCHPQVRRGTEGY